MWNKMCKKDVGASQKAVICSPPICHTQEIKDQLHSKWAKSYRRQMLHRDINNKVPKYIHDILRLNRHLENNINQINRPKNQRNYRSTYTEWSYRRIPYISERPNHKIANIFQRESIPVRIADRSHTLRRALSHTAERTFTRNKCPISHTNLCLRKNGM